MIEYELSANRYLTFDVDKEVFSPSNIDLGTLAMLKDIEIKKEDKILDLGCGYGFVGIFASETAQQENITMVDISEVAVRLSKENAIRNEKNAIHILKSDGLDDVGLTQFDWIFSNPPYHTDFSVPKKFIYQSYEKLVTGGKLVMVTKRKEWYKKRLIAVFGGVAIKETNGYFVFTAQKRQKRKRRLEKNKSGFSKKIARKLEKRGS